MITATHHVPSRRHLPRNCLVAIGASAGGPSALLAVLQSLPSGFSAPIVLVQHMMGDFARSLAEWLNFQVSLQVRVAEQDKPPRPGEVLVAGTGHHLVVKPEGKLAYTDQPHGCSYRPSIDVFFNSAARFWTGAVIGVLLTGLGRDGAAGLRTLRAHGHHTLAQDQATSAVYGMPKAAVELDAVEELLPLQEIGPRLGMLVMNATAYV